MSWQVWLGLLGLGVTLWLIVTHAALLAEVLWMLFGALLLGLAVRPLVDRFSGWRIPRWVTVLAVYVVFGLILALAGSRLAPTINAEVARLQDSGATLFQDAMRQIAATPILGSLIPSTTQVTQALGQRLDVLLGSAFSTAASLGGKALDALVMLIVAFFVAIDEDLGERILQTWVPERYRDELRDVWCQMQPRLTRWVWAQVAIALYFAVTFGVGLAILGVPFAFTIGLVGGILEIIPYLGGIVAAIFAVISAITVKPILAVWVLVYYLVVTEIESHVVAPAFYGRIMGLHPAIVLIALLVGAKAGGIIGALFAVPTAVVIAALLQEIRAVRERSESVDSPVGQAGGPAPAELTEEGSVR
jgi:predicted PurR-regulated permease PerM